MLKGFEDFEDFNDVKENENVATDAEAKEDSIEHESTESVSTQDDSNPADTEGENEGDPGDDVNEEEENTENDDDTAEDTADDSGDTSTDTADEAAAPVPMAASTTAEEQEDIFTAMGLSSGLAAKVEFRYQNKQEDIKDLSITFEDLRKQKQEDFVELEEPDKVRWNVTYLITKDVKNPKAKISAFKEELEKDSEFKKALKKNKKPLIMSVRPIVASKTKG